MSPLPPVAVAGLTDSTTASPTGSAAGAPPDPDEEPDAEAAGAKAWTTDLQFQVLDHCLQLHGGYGYMSEYEISRLWRDARVQRIYGGTNEVMKEIVGRSLGL